MPLSKQAIDITFGEGVQEGVGDKLLDAPKLLDLTDARFDKRGTISKRTGTTSTGASGLTTGQTGQALWAFGDMLVQSGSEGPHVYDPLESEWRLTNLAGPRPCEIKIDPLARGNGSYQHCSVAYSSADNLLCAAYADDEELAVRVAFYDTSTGERLRDDRVEFSKANGVPRVLFFNTVFVLLVADSASGNLYAMDYDPAIGDYSFGTTGALVHTGTPSDVDYDAHVYSASQSSAHVVIAKGTGGWVCYEINSFGAVLNTLTANTGRTANSIAVFHNADLGGGGKVYVAYPDAFAFPNQLSVDTFDDDYLSAPTKTKALDMTQLSDTNRRRVSLGLADSNKAEEGTLFVVTSHDYCDGDEHGGLDFNTVNADGTAGTESGFLPNLTLINKITNDSLGRAVFGACRDVDFDVPGSGAIDNALGDEPLRAAWLLTPVTYSTSSFSDNGQQVSWESESIVHGLAPLARYGHDRVYMSANSSLVRRQFVGSIALVGTELWGGFTVLDDFNPGMTQVSDHGWKKGVDLFRADCDPRGQQATDVAGATTMAGGVHATFDGRRLVEANVPFVPHALQYAGGFAGGGSGIYASCVGANTNNYTFPDPMAAVTPQYYIKATASYRYLFRWRDSRGNLHRSTVSPPVTWTFLGNNNLGSTELAYDTIAPLFGGNPTTNGNRLFVFPLPSFTSLSGEDGVRYQVELYRTGFYLEKRIPAAGSVEGALQEDFTYDDASTYKLVSVQNIGEVTDHPNLGYIEDPSQSQALWPDDNAPAPYDVGGELASEPPPAALDVASTQRRVFLLSSEDRLAIWYSKPLVKGVAHEFHNSLQVRVSAEGGDVEAIAALDDKLIVFKRSRIYAMAITQGPNANGTGPAFLQPREVASDTGCINRRSVVSGPFGVAFQSDRGLYLLGRDLGLQFLGEAVLDSLGSNTIRGATIIPRENEVRWALSNDTALHWDYLKRQWSIASNVPAQATARWLGEHAMLQASGAVEKSESGTYSSTISRPLLSATTSWIKLAGLQGFKRIWRVLWMLEHLSGALRIEVGYDYEDTWTDTHDFTEAQLAALGTPTQIRLIPTRQKCQAIRFRIQETDGTGDARTLTSGVDRTLTDGTTRTLTSGTSSPTIGQGFIIEGLRLVCGLRRGGYKHLGASAKR